jgi:hypothetical protein
MHVERMPMGLGNAHVDGIVSAYLGERARAEVAP